MLLFSKKIYHTATNTLNLFFVGCMPIQPNSISGHYHCHGADSEAGQYSIKNLTISQDICVPLAKNARVANYHMTIQDISTREGGSYTGYAIVDLHHKTGANFIGQNRNKPKDYGTGIIIFDKFDPQNSMLQTFNITYYEPAYHLNGQYVCIRSNSMGGVRGLEK